MDIWTPLSLTWHTHSHSQTFLRLSVGLSWSRMWSIWFDHPTNIICFQVSVMMLRKYHQIKPCFHGGQEGLLQQANNYRAQWLLVKHVFLFFYPLHPDLRAAVLHSNTHLNELGQRLRQQAWNEKHIMTAADFPPAKYNIDGPLQENYP